MDLDAYTAAQREDWDRLARLGRKKHFTGPEADELIDAYQLGATQLSAIKATAGQSIPGDRLSLLLSRARLRFSGARTNPFARIPEFFLLQIPAALYRIRWLSLWVTVACAIVAVVLGVWAANTPGVLAGVGSEEMRRRFAEEDFVNYYSEHGMGEFSALVWTNNAWIAAQCVAFGIVGFWVPYVLMQNAVNVGLSGALMAEHGHLDTFFLFIAPHGQLELYAIFAAGAAGLMIFWAWVAPGARTRAEALAEDGRALITIAVGLTMALLLSGIIEGFVTRQDWPWVIKVGIGTLALAAFLFYQWVVGGRAAKLGETGDLAEFEAGSKRIIAA